MSWETECTCSINFNRKTYDSLCLVEEDINECEEYLEIYKQKLLVLASSHPKDLVLKDCEGVELEVTDSIISQVNQVITDYEETLTNLIKLKYLQDNYETVQGDFIKFFTYCKCIKTTLFFEKDKCYGYNTKKDYRNKLYYFVKNSHYDFIKLTEEEFKEYFTQTTQEEYEKSNSH